jgi:hypothetical protein
MRGNVREENREREAVFGADAAGGGKKMTESSAVEGSTVAQVDEVMLGSTRAGEGSRRGLVGCGKPVSCGDDFFLSCSLSFSFFSFAFLRSSSFSFFRSFSLDISLSPSFSSFSSFSPLGSTFRSGCVNDTSRDCVSGIGTSEHVTVLFAAANGCGAD